MLLNSRLQPIFQILITWSSKISKSISKSPVECPEWWEANKCIIKLEVGVDLDESKHY
jgi:hypothetical protein